MTARKLPVVQHAVLIRPTVLIGWDRRSQFSVWRRSRVSGWCQTATFSVPGVRDFGEATVIALNHVNNTVGSD